MLPRVNRLLKKKDFDNVWKSGRSAFGRLLGVKAIKNELIENRFGITVGLKFSKKAVERNKIKRRLREILRRKSPSMNPGFDVAITVLPAARLSDFEDLKKEIEWCFRKLNIG
jgi:ribonuclease P protein component